MLVLFLFCSEVRDSAHPVSLSTPPAFVLAKRMNTPCLFLAPWV